MKFSKWFKELRLKTGKTQAQLAAHLGYRSSQFVSNWERGISLPPNGDLLYIAKFLNIDPVELVDKAMLERKYNCSRIAKTAMKKRAINLKEKLGLDDEERKEDDRLSAGSSNHLIEEVS